MATGSAQRDWRRQAPAQRGIQRGNTPWREVPVSAVLTYEGLPAFHLSFDSCEAGPDGAEGIPGSVVQIIASVPGTATVGTSFRLE